MTRMIRGLVMACLLLACASQAWAGFTLTPGVNFRLEYNDNIDLESDNEKDDFITTITPTLLMKWETPRIDLSLDARIMFQKYVDNTDEDRIGPGEADQGSTFNALIRLYPDVFFLRVSDSYQRVPIDEGGRGGQGNNTVNLTDSNQLTINPYLQFEPMSELQATLGYSYENLWYGNQSTDSNEDSEDAGDDSESHTFSAGLTKTLSPRVKLSLSGSRLMYRPKDAADTYIVGEEGVYEYDEDNVRIGLTYEVNDRLMLEGGYGHSWLDYDVREDTDSSVWDVKADYEISGTVKTGISYVKSYTVTVEDGPSDTDRLAAYLTYDKRMSIRLAAYIASEDYVEIDRSNDSYGGDLGGSLPFTDKYGLDWGLRYANYDQTGFDAEKYDRYGANMAFYYDISRGRLSLGYTYTRNNSDLEDSDYTNNIIFLSANFTL